jgi:flagellar capping protein FliD
VQSFLQGVGGFANNLNTVVGGLTDTISGVLGLDAVGLTQTSQSLSKQITDLQTALAVQTTNLTAVYAQVNATLQELPLLQSQLTQQLASVA